MWEANEDNLEAIAMGAGILGTGGGGNPYIGQLRARQAIKEHGPVTILDPEEPPEDEYQPNNRLSRPRWPLQALTMSPTTLPRMFRKMDSQKASPNLSG